MARKGNPISVRLDLNRSSDSSRFSGGTINISIFVILLSFQIQMQLKKRGLDFTFFKKKHILILILLLFLSRLFMNELYNAVVPFLAASGGSRMNPLPGPSGDSSLYPLFYDESGPSEGHPTTTTKSSVIESGPSEGHPTTTTKSNVIDDLQKDPYLSRSFKTACIRQEEIINLVEELSKEQKFFFTRGDIKAAIEGYLINIMEKNPPYRNTRLKQIVQELQSQRLKSKKYLEIVKEIRDLFNL